jgi:hypothetical protein
MSWVKIVLLVAVLGAMAVDFQVLHFAATPLNLQVGTGTADVTGPAADLVMMGYAQATQIAHGIHFRLRSRGALHSLWIHLESSAVLHTLASLHSVRCR